MPAAELTDDTAARLKKLAEPLVDTYDTVISKLLDQYEATQGGKPRRLGEPVKVEGDKMLFDWKNPPSLGFTTLIEVLLDGEAFPKSELYWNKLMNRMIVQAAGDGMDAESIDRLLFVNSVVGEKNDNGYTYLRSTGVSVQGQDSNASFRQAFALANELGIKLQVSFYWQENPKAAHPGQQGLFRIS